MSDPRIERLRVHLPTFSEGCDCADCEWARSEHAALDSLNEGTARDALADIWRTAFFQHSNWMHFHELAMAEPFGAEGEAQAFCQAISTRAYVALQAIGVTDDELGIRVYTAGDVQQDGVA